jgi:type I restriction enzyme S subunit
MGIAETSLPTLWKFVRLGDIAKTTSGGTPRRDKPHFYGGKIPWVKSGELADRIVYETSEAITEEAIKSSSAKVFPKGTLCIALYGATVGKLGILGVDAATNQAVCAIFPSDELDTRYLYRFFESIRRALVEQGKGGAQPNISQAIIRDTQIPIGPIVEQRRIVAEIEKQFARLEAGVTALRGVQANLRRYRAAVLKAACEGQLVPMEAELHQLSGEEQKRFESGAQLLQRTLAERRQRWTGRGEYREPAAPDISDLAPLPTVGHTSPLRLSALSSLDDSEHHSTTTEKTCGPISA